MLNQTHACNNTNRLVAIKICIDQIKKTQTDYKIFLLTDLQITNNGDIDIIQSSGTCPTGVTGCYGVINADFDSENAVIDIKQKDTGD